jgi:hypothetical protein
MSQENELPYINEYTKFIDQYKTAEVSAEEVGVLIVRMASYFAEQNLKMVLANRALALVAKEAEETVDESTGKQISSAKATKITEATDEAYVAAQAKCHKENCEQFINALKALQKGITNEYNNSSL